MSDTPKDAKGIFLAALDIQNPDERAAFVVRSCQGDDPLQKRVEDLLRAYGESGGPLDKMAAAIATTRLGEPIREQVGSTIGPYKLMEQIGEGGFGLVFVAEQQQPIRRKVALKIIKPGMDTRDVIARFEAERQALALMDHPNIARVLDAGTTESGRPYFVMELVRGIPITDYCDQAQLTPRERLELFVPVCNAIQHAHLKGIIHRDVKPSNVLVTLHDDRPVVKVIDFGVAKALYQSLTERTIYTRYAQMIGTPLYMSPEQAQMSGLDIDTRSDIYSLGVLLYELLTGSTPFNKERLAKAAYDELLKIIREEEPPKPSLRLSQSGDSLPSIAAQRKTEPAKLSKMFSGDLDWIAMKALEKDRTRRYETANAFAADVLRYLNDEPVEASPPSAVYRMRKFARKHRRPVIALAALVAILMLGIGGTTWGLFRAQRAERAADVSKEEAIDALGQATKERDAKVTALTAEAAARDQAERQLAYGLLRPIGFSGSGLGDESPGELRSFVDWSAIPDSRLKLRVLEIAFEEPDTALRVAKRAEQVIQSCVGLSPKRRDKAIKLVSARQRDLAADPRIRVSACWLALELGTPDLQAWPESCTYLSDNLSDRFSEFVTFATSRTDPGQIAELGVEPLLVLLATSTDTSVLSQTCSALVASASRLDGTQAARAMDALIANGFEKAQMQFGGFGFLPQTPDLFSLIVARLEPQRVARVTGALITLLDKVLNGDSDDFSQVAGISSALAALVPRLNPTQAEHVAESVIARLDKLRDGSADYVAKHQTDLPTLLGLLKPLAPRLGPDRAAHVGDALTALAVKRSTVTLGTGVDGFAAVVPRIEGPTAQRIADAAIAALPAPLLVEQLTALAPRMQSAQAANAWDSVIKLVKSPPQQPNSMRGLPDPRQPLLIALAPRLDPQKAKREGENLIAVLEKSATNQEVSRALTGLIAMIQRLERGQVKRAADALIRQLQKKMDDELADSRWWVLQTLAPRLDSAEAKRAWELFAALSDWYSPARQTIVTHLDSRDVESAADPLIAILESSVRREKPTEAENITPSQAQVRSHAEVLLTDLATRLNSRQAQRAVDALIQSAEAPPAQLFAALVPRLDLAQVSNLGDTLAAKIEKSTEPKTCVGWAAGLAVLVPRLTSVSRDAHATRIVPALLDNSVWNPVEDSFAPQYGDVQIAQYISSPRSLAKLLSHPGCVAELRTAMLQRFEELAFYDGKPVFLKPENPDAQSAAHDQAPPRRFHNLHDAAVWIRQNWPDFDLDANCPATLRGSR
jgi:serine/threonine protein kinase